jgi:acyl carrier protein
VEPSEIEYLLTTHPAISQAAVIAHTGDDGVLQLVAYVVVVAGLTPNVEEVRSHLAAELPPYMVPSTYVVLPALPLTASGKLDKAKLPAPTAGPGAEYVAPSTSTQETLVDIWRGLLTVDKIGVHDNFFALGGNSLQATQLVSRIRDAFNVTLDLRTLFTNSTVAQLADLVEAEELADLSDEELAELLAGVEHHDQ